MEVIAPYIVQNSQLFNEKSGAQEGANVIIDRSSLVNQRGNNVIGSGLTDDDFFHLTCHIDANLKTKIEKGQYVDLDKLL